MKGWLILRHSLRQVFANLEGALRVSAVLYLAQIVISVVLTGGVLVGSGGMESFMTEGPSAGLLLAALVAGVASVVAGLWIAVAWHRYVLLGEMGSWMPRFHGDRIWAYFLRGLGYGLLLALIGGIWGMLVGSVLAALFSGSMLMIMVGVAVLVYLPLLVIGFRMTSDLPAMALGADRPFFSGWAATTDANGDLAVMAIILVAAALILGLFGHYVFGAFSILAFVWSLVMGWIQTMVGVSILTTLYGHYIEKRDLV